MIFIKVTCSTDLDAHPEKSQAVGLGKCSDVCPRAREGLAHLISQLCWADPGLKQHAMLCSNLMNIFLDTMCCASIEMIWHVTGVQNQDTPSWKLLDFSIASQSDLLSLFRGGWATEHRYLPSQLQQGKERAGLDAHPEPRGCLLLHLNARRWPEKAAC